ncbi:ABC transporter ATP-binding protein [endosymbiont of unidentified scaly snail isolate Monju]|uniref:ABC transporter ATP-binding protein n=1 Tax=endosymbiont of unidentified scaly snail isolate Monju TaxID=1248727 RepID=UPI000389266C|nr:ABC transporter ATP-binding protein [endosymbiont of unidentified scaly snail isolate Monju]BAN68469.1 iron(III) ABC transporter ATP-binding protein [endosymbiont of unidentified scaly snail isolate Monju]
MPLLKVDDIAVAYDERPVVEHLSFHVNRGEIVSLLGASGCGKTTALRAIAGFEPVRTGKILIDHQVVSTPDRLVPPEQRHIGMVFQDYALFPHLTVAENIAFGLQGLSPSERHQRVRKLLSAVGLHDLGKRYPHELSGGQQQRVALARALAPRPTLLLMDEPFSNLDVELRERLGLEVRDLLRDQGTTAILVTHDQHEAFAMSDHVGVMHQGHILQWDTPYNLYHEPADRFVADFIGQGVFIDGKILAPARFQTEFGVLEANRCSCRAQAGDKVDILLRPDDVVPDDQSPLQLKVVERAFRGTEILYTLESEAGTRLLALFPSHHDHATGERVRVRIGAQHVICFPHTAPDAGGA